MRFGTSRIQKKTKKIDMSKFNTIELEKSVIRGCLKYPNLFYEIEPLISPDDFQVDIHKGVYSVIRSQIEANAGVDVFLIVEKLKNCGITFKDVNIGTYEYLDYLKKLGSISEKGFISAALELKKMSTCRDIYNSSQKMQEFLVKNTNKNFSEIISTCDKIYNDKILSLDSIENPENVFENIQEIIEEIGNSPSEETGFLTPYADFNDLNGGLRPKNLYAFTARPKHGKTTFLSDMLYKVCNVVPSNKDKGIKCLYLDTEMEKEDMQKRLIASISGVPFWYIDTGNWRKDPNMVKKVRAAWPLVSKYNFYHFKAKNKPIEEIVSIARRWYYSQVGRGNPAIICYDYLKMTGESTSDSWKEYQVIGEKTDRLKRISEELNVPLLTSTQLNRTGENQNKKAGSFADDSSAIAMSDRLQWFASYVGIFRKKTIDEVELDGENNGTHKLITTASRFQGKLAAGHQDFVQRTIDGEKRYVSNYISFDVDNFNVKEVGALSSLQKRGALTLQIFDDEGNVVKTVDGKEDASDLL